MSVWKCPYCESVAIVIDPRTCDGVEDIDDTCPKIGCRAIMVRLDEPDAGNAIRRAFYNFDHASLDRLNQSVVALGDNEIGDAP